MMEGAEKEKKKKRGKGGKKEDNRVRASVLFFLFVCLGNRQFCSVDDMEGSG